MSFFSASGASTGRPGCPGPAAFRGVALFLAGVVVPVASGCPNSVSHEGQRGPSAVVEVPLSSAQAAAGVEAGPTAFVWPEGHSSAVSLTYDDALVSQLDNAVPALRKHHLLGTFFLTGDVAKANAARWSAVHGLGHELASHTMAHPCEASQSWVAKGNALEDYNLGRMRRELEDSVALLTALGMTRPFTFAYPCGVTWLGPNHVSYVSLVNQLFLASRGVGSRFADPVIDPLGEIPAHSGDKSAEALLQLAEESERKGGWLVLMFHGIGGDYLAATTEAHDALLAHLDRRRATVWTEPFGKVAQYIANHPTSALRVGGPGRDE